MQGSAGDGRLPLGPAHSHTSEGSMSLVGSLIAVSLLLLAGLGIAGMFLMGRTSRDANDDDPKPGP
jgi:hypothetical protein